MVLSAPAAAGGGAGAAGERAPGPRRTWSSTAGVLPSTAPRTTAEAAALLEDLADCAALAVRAASVPGSTRASRGSRTLASAPTMAQSLQAPRGTRLRHPRHSAPWKTMAAQADAQGTTRMTRADAARAHRSPTLSASSRRGERSRRGRRVPHRVGLREDRPRRRCRDADGRRRIGDQRARGSARARVLAEVDRACDGAASRPVIGITASRPPAHPGRRSPESYKQRPSS